MAMLSMLIIGFTFLFAKSDKGIRFYEIQSSDNEGQEVGSFTSPNKENDLRRAMSFLISVTCQCADGFLKHGNSCYHFSGDTETWLDALVACEKIYKGHLAEIKDAYENNFLLNEVNTRGGRFWIGGSDLQVEGEWKWYTTNTNITYSTWYPGNPSGGNEDCLEIVKVDGKGTLWNDLQCHSFQKYICEKAINEGEIIG